MKKIVLIALLLVGVLFFQGIAEAASISTRVRILESKTYKLGKEIDRQKSENVAQSEKLDQGLQEIHQLKKKVEKFMQDSKKQQHTQEDTSHSYSFP